MYKVTVECSFITKTEEQAKYIRQFFDDAQSLMSCESSSFSGSNITQVNAVQPGGAYKLPVLALNTRSEAEEVLDQMRKMIMTYLCVTVEDLYELLDLRANFTDSKWGWRTTSGFSIKEEKGGFVLILPPPRLISLA